MRLAELVKDVGLESSAPVADVTVAGITDDSRSIAAGDVFIAVAGAASDGHEHAQAAVAAGAAAVLAERPLPQLGVPVVVVRDLKRHRSALASKVFDQPSRALTCVGVTGTNGKTSIASFVAELADALGERAGYMGTIGWGEVGHLASSSLTTESAITIQRRLAGFRESGLTWAVLEVSSHAMDQHRVDAVVFDYAVFSNLSRDHLDYHGDIETYGAAKARLFELPALKAAVVNVDDAFGRDLVDRLGADLPVLTYGEEAPQHGAGNAAAHTVGHVSWQNLRFDPFGVSGEFITPWGSARFELPLYGRFSVANAAAALAVLCQAGAQGGGAFELTDVVAALGRIRSVPGRMEFFPGRPTVVVDYAHTPDALEKMLTGIRPHVAGRVFVVCGCGGDRDKGKRPLMARAACRNADRVWLTSDNPRNEDPEAIIHDMLPGVPDGAAVEIVVDRRSAILAAVDAAAATDVVVVAGKGHEDYQETRGRREPFSDREIAAMLTGRADKPAVENPSCCSG
jgi:UDP-N-acetylmuramoyl-L-alanyl-D-glutamate--2,6-diaminopimelate ligase